MQKPKMKTLLTHVGRGLGKKLLIANSPITRASTIFFNDYQHFKDELPTYNEHMYYGRLGTPTTEECEQALSAITGAHGTKLFTSGLQAITTSILAYAKAGDHILVTESLYGSTRHFCDTILPRFGIEVTYYSPTIAEKIAEWIRPNTKVIFTESPGSYSFDIQDIPAIVKVAHEHHITVILDNTWASPLFFRGLDHGVDVEIHSITKFLGGHSDLVMGSASTNKKSFKALKVMHTSLGQAISPDDCYTVLRSIRTLDLRMQRHFESTLAIASWLEKQPLIDQVYYPALPSHHQHDLWKRDFLGASSLFSFTFKKEYDEDKVGEFLNHLEIFKMGYSWAAYESLIVPIPTKKVLGKKTPFRLHIGFEDVEDLKADLEAGFKRIDG